MTESCPDQDLLRRFALGHDVDDPEHLASHLAACQSCREWIEHQTDLWSTRLKEFASDKKGDMETSKRPSGRPAVESGQTIRGGELLLVREIGSGGMGCVWQAYQASLDQFVALKFCLVDDDSFATAIESEAKLAAKVRHSNVVAVRDSFPFDGKAVVVMDYIDGLPLNQRIARSPPTTELVIRWIKQICNALSALHESGILHGDVKPSNLLVDRKDDQYVTDFGISSAFDQHSARLAGGTPGYDAPEHSVGSGTVQTDIYGIGRVIEHMLGAVKPTTKSDRYTLQRIENIAARCTRDLPSERFADCQQILAQLPNLRPPRGFNRQDFLIVGGLSLVSIGLGYTIGRVAEPDPFEGLNDRQRMLIRFSEKVFAANPLNSIMVPREFSKQGVMSVSHLHELFKRSSPVTGVTLYVSDRNRFRNIMQDIKSLRLPILTIESTVRPLTDADLRLFVSIDSLTSLYLANCNLKDDDLRILSDKENLTAIGCVMSPEITDDCFGFLLDCEKLIDLDLRHTSVTKEGMLRFAERSLARGIFRTFVLSEGDPVDLDFQSKLEDLGHRFERR